MRLRHRSAELRRARPTAHKLKRDAYVSQVNNLIGQLSAKVREDGAFKILRFNQTGSLAKGTQILPKIDADIAVFLDFDESTRFDLGLLHDELRRLLVAIYPQKTPEDFQVVQPRTLGITFHASGLEVDLVPVVPVEEGSEYAWQPSSAGGDPVLTSIALQLSFIRERKAADRRYRKLVRLMKAWRNTNELLLPVHNRTASCAHS